MIFYIEIVSIVISIPILTIEYLSRVQNLCLLQYNLQYVYYYYNSYLYSLILSFEMIINEF